MKKIVFYVVMITLILQSFLSPIGAFANSSQIFLLKNEVVEEKRADSNEVNIVYDWEFSGNASEEEKNYHFPLPDNIQIVETQSGTLSINNNAIGSFVISSLGIAVTIYPNMSDGGVGQLAFTGVKMEAPPATAEESSSEISEEKQNLFNEPLETDNDQAEMAAEDEAIPEVGQQMIEENILTNATLSFENQNGEQVDEVDLKTIVIVNYEWALPIDHKYKNGATFEFHLPEELKVYETITNQEIYFGNDVIGTFSVDANGRVTMIFNHFIETHSNISGRLEVLSKLQESLEVTEDRKISITPIVGQPPQDIPILFISQGNSMDKNGNPDKGYNARSISWSIDFNKHLESIENAVFTDPIPEGQEFQANSIKIYKLITRMNGETEIGEEITKAIEKTEDGKDFRISFGNINSAYRIEFLTDITDPNGTSYRNTAVLSGENIEDMEASATVGVRRGIPLAKSSTAYNGATQTIDWEIKFNYNEKNIPVEEAKLTDLFNNTQKLVDGSFKVEKVTIDDNGNEANSEEVSSDKYDITPLLEEDRDLRLNLTNRFKKLIKLLIRQQQQNVYLTKKR